MFKRLKNIEDNLIEVDDNDNKVGIFRIEKDIKDRGIKIDNDDTAIREIRKHVKELIDDGIKVNSFNEMKEEIIEHIKNLRAQGSKVKIGEEQINDLINKIFDKEDEKDKKDKSLRPYLKDFLRNNGRDFFITCEKNRISTEKINSITKKYIDERYDFPKFIDEYNKYMESIK